MSLRQSTIALGMMATFAAMNAPAYAGTYFTPSSQIFGEVRNSSGTAQMGAAVSLYNRYDQLVRHAITNESGKFIFDGLAADVYSVRVSLASFAPAIRRNIALLAGSEKMLNISLAGVLSTIELAPLSTPAAALMSDEWKWVLRASQSTRPALRFLPASLPAPTTRTAASMFSDTTGVVRVSAGGSDPLAGDIQQNLGTAFGVATSINGNSLVRVSGNLGYVPVSGLPSASFRATYARSGDATRGAQVALTARQIYLPSLTGSGMPGSIIGPVMRTAALTAVDRLDLTDKAHLEYGVSLESIAYQDRLNYMSTFGRATYEFGANGTAKFAYSSATDPEDLIAREGEKASDLNHDLATLSKLPRISRRGDRTRVQRNQNYEAGYAIVDGSRTYTASAFVDDVSNAAFLLSGSLSMISAGDMLPDLNSRGIMFNAGSFRRSGYTVSMTQALGEKVEVTVAAGRASALVAHTLEKANPSGEDLRGAIHASPRPWATVRATATVPVVGTFLSGSYGWTDFRALTPVHFSLTSKASQEVGWNIGVRQPLPRMGGVRMEAAAELRNLLAQGYLPLTAGDRRSILTNSPRGIRGGLSFIF